MALNSATCRAISSRRMYWTRTFERQLDRVAPAAQDVVEAALDAGEALAVEIGKAHDMGREAALGIDAAAFGLELQAGDAEAVDLEFLARGQLPLDPHEAPVGGELGGDLAFLDIGEQRGELLRHALGGLDQLGIGVERGRVQRGGEQHAVAVDDVGARHLGPLGDMEMRQSPVAALESRHFDEARADHQEGEAEQRAGDDEPRVAGLQRLLGRPLQRRRGAGRRLEVPRAAGVVVLGQAGRHRNTPDLLAMASRGAAISWEEADGGAAAAAAGGMGDRRGSCSMRPICCGAIGPRVR